MKLGITCYIMVHEIGGVRTLDSWTFGLGLSIIYKIFCVNLLLESFYFFITRVDFENLDYKTLLPGLFFTSPGGYKSKCIIADHAKVIITIIAIIRWLEHWKTSTLKQLNSWWCSAGQWCWQEAITSPGMRHWASCGLTDSLSHSLWSQAKTA